MITEFGFKESLRFPSNRILHASPRFDSGSVLVRCRFRQRRGRTIARPNTQENLCDANADTASEKENNRCDRDEKEIADANTITHAVGHGFTKKEKDSCRDGRNAIAKSEEEKRFANSYAELFAAS